MDIYIYSDESGVFDAKHNRYFVFAGTVFLSKKDKESGNDYICIMNGQSEIVSLSCLVKR